MMSRKLPEVCEIQYGFPFDSSLFSAEGDLPLIRIRDVVRGYTETYTSEKCDVAYLVHEGDILVGMDGVFNVAKWKGEPAYLNQRVCRIIPNETIDADFLFYFIPTALKKIENETAFVTVKHLKAKQLNAVVVPDVPIEEQKKIAAQLNVISHLISLRQQQAEKLDELVKARFVEMFGEGKYGGNPLSNVCKLITDGTHQPPQFVDAGIPFLLVSNLVHNEITYDTEKFISKESYQELIKRTPVEIGDILLSIVGSYGHAGVVRTDKPFCFQRHIAYIKPDFSKLNSEFLHHALLSDAVKYQMEKRVKGIAQKTLNLSELKKIVVPIPPLALQTEFSHFVHEVDREKERIQRSAALLETLKRSLMQQYFG